MSEFDQSDPKVVYSRLVDLLARREHSQFELKQKLLAKQFSSHVIDAQIEYLVQAGLQSDLRYTEVAVREWARKGKGPLYIAAQLQQKRIHSQMMYEVFDELQVDWFENALAVRCKRFDDVDLADFKQKQKCYRYLAKRGFDSEQVQYAMKPVTDDWYWVFYLNIERDTRFAVVVNNSYFMVSCKPLIFGIWW